MQAPHPPLQRYYTEESERSAWVRDIFDRTARDYDRIERIMAFGSGPWYRGQALQRAGLKQGMRVLDVGTGTGLTAREAAYLAGGDGRVTGVDPSRGMRERAVLPAQIELLEGSAEHIPVAADSADFLSMGYALRHVADLSVAFTEFMRVLAPGGTLCLLEITPPQRAWRTWLLKAYMRGVVPLLAWAVGARGDVPRLMRYYWDTIESCAPPGVILEALKAAGFSDARRHVELGIFSEYTARKPALSR